MTPGAVVSSLYFTTSRSQHVTSVARARSMPYLSTREADAVPTPRNIGALGGYEDVTRFAMLTSRQARGELVRGLQRSRHVARS
ncbi:unnamed protein product [Strongylus vulgaris]|uniref:Uncharacterized protein n=1 Tax=Strongylus vulgaris TaxID=40348 RepID=A0A3P7JIU2_STRVU|nr:unnamed protein product [Strongylus vulgaris]